LDCNRFDLACEVTLHLLANAERFFEEMPVKLGVIHDERSYLEIIRAFAAREDSDRCKAYHIKMKKVPLARNLSL